MKHPKEDCYVGFRATPALKAKIKRASKQKRKTVSEYLRYIVVMKILVGG
jgi:hypothetical protein